MKQIEHAVASAGPDAMAGWDLRVVAAGIGAVLLLAFVLAAMTVVRKRQVGGPARDRGRAVDTLLTVIAAGMLTSLSIDGMWRVFHEALGLSGPLAVLVTASLEVTMIVSAFRARTNLRESGSVGVDGAAVWVIALMSGSFAFAEEPQPLGRWVRFVAPLIAAWLWERSLAPDRRAVRERKQSEIAWRWTRERLAVLVGLADPSGHSGSEVMRARRLARLVRVAHRAAVLGEARPPAWFARFSLLSLRRYLALRALDRQGRRMIVHGMGTDPAVAETIRTTVATVIGLRDALTREAVADASHWRPVVQSSPAPVVAAEEYRPQVRAVLPESPPGAEAAGRPRPIAGTVRRPTPVASAAPVAPGAEVDDPVARLIRAVAVGDLPQTPTVVAVQKYLRVGQKKALEARRAYLAERDRRATAQVNAAVAVEDDREDAAIVDLRDAGRGPVAVADHTPVAVVVS